MQAMSKRPAAANSPSTSHNQPQRSSVPGLIPISGAARHQSSASSSPSNRKEKKRQGPSKGMFEVDLRSSLTSISSRSAPPTAGLASVVDPKTVDPPPTSMIISSPSGRIARARAQRHQSTSDAAPSIPLPPPSAPIPIPSTKRPRSASTVKTKLPKTKPKHRSKPKGQKYRREFKDDLDIALDLFHAPPPADPHSYSEPSLLRSGMVDISTPPTTPSPTSPPAHASFGFALPTPPHTPPRSTYFQHSRSHSFPAIPSPTSEFRYANSTFQHSPSAKVIPRPRFMDVEMEMEF